MSGMLVTVDSGEHKRLAEGVQSRPLCAEGPLKPEKKSHRFLTLCIHYSQCTSYRHRGWRGTRAKNYQSGCVTFPQKILQMHLVVNGSHAPHCSSHLPGPGSSLLD